MLKEACRLYAASWVRDIGPELRPHEYRKKAENEDSPNGEKGESKQKEPSTLEDLGKGYFLMVFREECSSYMNERCFVFIWLVIYYQLASILLFIYNCCLLAWLVKNRDKCTI